MRYCAGVIALLVPLAFLPVWSFYYDVTPKAVFLLAGASTLLLARIRVLNIETTPMGRRNSILLLCLGAAVALSAFASSGGAEVWIGSNWRRMGVITTVALLAASWRMSAEAARDVRVQTAVLAGLCTAGGAAAAYGIAQYFGLDPFLDASAYRFGEGEYQIVRPPGPMGHSNYLAAFLLSAVFAGLALARTTVGQLRNLGRSSAALAILAIGLCGSRGAWVGLGAGALVWFAIARPRQRVVAAALAIGTLAAGLFYVSPAGEQMRARVFWIGEDSAGGSRLMLWRDSLRMATHRPFLGFGPDSFVAEFPRFQSPELSQSFPAFFHESPHNLFLDVLVNHGFVGLLALVALIVCWVQAGQEGLRRGSPVALPLLCGLTAMLVAHQFASLVLPTAFSLLVMGSLLSNVEVARQKTLPRWTNAVAVAAALTLLIAAFRLAADDFRLGRIRTSLDRGDAAVAADLWSELPDRAVVRADLYFAQRWAAESARAQTALEKLRYAQFAANAAAAATSTQEQRQNAFYYLAILQAAANDSAAVERSLRASADTAPTWFKPRWALARLLWSENRRDEARAQAQTALDLNGGHDQEVRETLAEILGSGSARR